MNFRERLVARALYPVSNLFSRAVMKAWQRVSEAQPQFLFRGVPDRLGPEHLAPDARLYADRETMVEMLPKDAVGAEVGTYKGIFARRLLDVCQPRELHLFDRDFSLVPEAVRTDGRVELRTGDSSSNLSQCPESSFDWIYIDGDHRLEGAAKDTEAAARALKPGGLLMFNDYLIFDAVSSTPFGVIHAANRLCVEHGYVVVGFALHRDGYNDILIRKPF